jgi:hypothetical protein
MVMGGQHPDSERTRMRIYQKESARSDPGLYGCTSFVLPSLVPCDDRELSIRRRKHAVLPGAWAHDAAHRTLLEGTVPRPGGSDAAFANGDERPPLRRASAACSSMLASREERRALHAQSASLP